MALLAQTDPTVDGALRSVVRFLPTLAACIAILVAGYLIARLLERLVASLLERTGFTRLAERSGAQRLLAGTEHDAAGVLAKIVFYGAMLFVLQLAFGIFGPNPISELLNGLIAFLPRLFVAIVIVVVAAAVAAGVRDLVRSLLGGVTYGGLLGTAVYAVVLGIGVFAALDQLAIAPTIVTGLFYALLAIVVGVAVVAVGGGGIAPMRARWERALDRLDEEAPRMRASARDERARREAEEQRRREEEERARKEAEEQRRREEEERARKEAEERTRREAEERERARKEAEEQREREAEEKRRREEEEQRQREEEERTRREAEERERARQEAEEQERARRVEEAQRRREEERRRREEAQAEKQRRAEQQVIRSTPPPEPVHPADEDTVPPRRRDGDSETDPTLSFDPDETQAIRRPDGDAATTTEDVARPRRQRRRPRSRSDE